MVGNNEDHGRLLAGLRVLDLSGGETDMVTRLLADLGADVVKAEPPGGTPARTELPALAGISIPFALHNANKRSVVLDPDTGSDRDRLVELAGTADIVVDSGRPGQAAAYGTSCTDLADCYPHLVTLAISDFGAAGPRSSWQATDAVIYALSGALSRSGPPVGTPVLPPDGIASATAAVQAAWAALVAYYNRLRCGVGDYIDFSRYEAVVTALDPVFGTQGQVAAARRRPDRWRGRPKNQDNYPIYPCRDGYVRICVMAPRQWHGLRAWLGEPGEFQDPKYDTIPERVAAWPQIGALVADLFAGGTMGELVSAGREHGVPIAAVLTPSQALASEHFTAIGALTDTELGAGAPARVPVGPFVVNGHHAGFRAPAPEAGSDDARWVAKPAAATAPTAAVGDRPFAGMRIIDLGVIVAGAETSRLFGDLGAEIIKVESAAHPDGLRQFRVGEAMSESFAWARRNNLAVGLDLRNAEGKKLFEHLVAGSDAVFANFKPTTLAALGFSFETLRALNPAIVLAESSAFGDAGPWSTGKGYGPLVRATTGVTRLWTSPEAGAAGTRHSRHPFYDATTIFPDHVIGRLSAIGALAALIRRGRSGAGARVHIAQAEVVINQLDTGYVTRAAPGHIDDDTSVHAICPCAGDDEWCVISIRSDTDWRSAAAVFGRPELADDPRFATGESRTANRAELVAVLSAWTGARFPLAAAEALQSASVPAGQMNRAPDLAEDPQLAHRKVFSDMTHPLIDHPLPAETGPAPFRNIPAAPQQPAPLAGRDTREICTNIIGLTTERIDELIADGVLFVADG